ncbi:MAG: hypothetical protein OEU55_10315 [Desulfobacterales bacterium]|nr:hypothetical protein [Desulfobacterales bacterium]
MSVSNCMELMRELFKDILRTDGVSGVMLFSFKGDLIFKEFKSSVNEGPEGRDWSFFIESLEGMRETDLVFEKGRIYIRKTGIGYVVILMALFVPIAMIRLNCDILLPSLKPPKSGKKFGRFFRKKGG